MAPTCDVSAKSAVVVSKHERCCCLQTKLYYNAKKCSEDCILAPHFPGDDPDKFTTVQRVFGTGHIVKMLQGIEAAQRAVAVNSIVYEPSARLKDVVHGCAKNVHQLPKQIGDLESQLAVKQAELKHMLSEYDNLVLVLSTASLDSTSESNEDGIYDMLDPLMSWELLWDK